MLDIKLDINSHDIIVDNFDLQLCEDDLYLVQKLKIKFLFFYGEWFLDITQGIKYYEEILIKDPNISTIDNMFKLTIMEDGYFSSIIEYQSNFDLQKREFLVSFKAMKNNGEIFVFPQEVLKI